EISKFRPAKITRSFWPDRNFLVRLTPRIAAASSVCILTVDPSDYRLTCREAMDWPGGEEAWKNWVAGESAPCHLVFQGRGFWSDRADPSARAGQAGRPTRTSSSFWAILSRLLTGTTHVAGPRPRTVTVF